MEFPPINTRKKYDSVTNSIARKGVQRVEDPLVRSRGNTLGFPPINTRKKYDSVTNSIARKGQGRNSLVRSRGNAPWGYSALSTVVGMMSRPASV